MRTTWLPVNAHFIPTICWLILFWFSCTVVVAAPAVDPQLESELDDYLQLTSEDMNAARALLQKIAPKVTAMTPDATKVRFNSLRISELEIDKNYPEVEKLLQKNWQIAEQNQDPDIWSEVLTDHLNQYSFRGDNAKAVGYLDPLLQYAKQATQTRVRYYAWNSAGNFQAWQGKFELALASYHQAYAVIENDEHPRTKFRKMYLKSQMASLQSSLRNYSLAIQTIQQGLAEALANPELQSYAAEFYTQEGYVLVELGELDAALLSNQQGLIWARKLKYEDHEVLFKNNIGDIYLRQGKLDMAKELFEQCFAYGMRKQQKATTALAAFNLGYIQVLQGEYEPGIAKMQQMLKELESVIAKSDVLGYMIEVADAHRFAGKHQAEAEVLRQYNQLSSDIFQSEREKQLNQLQEEFSAKEKTKEILALTQQNQLKEVKIERQQLQQEVTMLIGVVVLLASCLLFLLYRKVRHANLKLKEVNDKLAYQSLRDPLTGLYNRRSLLEHMDRREHNERRVAAPELTDGFILLDIDFFKHINDHYGHAAGDAVLIEIARRLTELTRNEDMVWRWGGEEFLILLRRVDIKALANFTQRVLDTIGNSNITFEQQQIQVTASAGFLTYPFNDLDEETLTWPKALQLADMALYLGKVHGRNRAYGLSCLHQPYQEIAVQLETDLSLAIEKGLVDVVLVEGPARDVRH
jgi:diguanylate cyclase (GGDEF)-like protein